MALRRWWPRFTYTRNPLAPVRPRSSRFRPRLEMLEERVVPAVQLVSAAASGTSSTANGTSVATNQGSISDDGRYVVYLSDATNLVSGQSDTNTVGDVFLYDK